MGIFLDRDERAVEFPVSAEGIGGDYAITVTVDDKKYDTGIHVTF